MNHSPEMLSADRQRLLKEHLMDEITRETAAPRRRPVWLVAPPLVAAVAVAAVLVGPGRGSGRPAPAVGSASPSPSVSTPPASPAELLLRRAEKAAEARPAPAARDNQFTYQHEIEDGGGQARHERSMWFSVDGRSDGLIVDPTMPGPGGRPSEPSGPLNRVNHDGTPVVAGFANQTYKFVAALPTDPQQVLKQLYEAQHVGDPNPMYGSEADRKASAFGRIQSVFMNVTAPGPQAAALMEVAARLPGTTLVADEVDAAGRHGVAVVGPAGGTAQASLIFDPETGAFLGVKVVMLRDLVSGGPDGGPATSPPRPGNAKGDVFTTAVLQVGITDHTGETPKG